MTSNPLADIIASKGWCVADGATGTNLFARGLEMAIRRNYGRLNGRVIFCGCITVFLTPDLI